MAVALGFATAFVICMSPGPVAVFILVESAQGRKARALAVAFGSTLLETAMCFLVFAGLGSVLAPVANSTSMQIAAISALATLGVVFFLSPKRKLEPTTSKASGFLLGLFLCSLTAGTLGPWLVASTSLLASGVADPTVTWAGMYSAGVALGALSWYSILILAGGRLERHREVFAAYARRMVAGVLFLSAGIMAATMPV